MFSNLDEKALVDKAKEIMQVGENYVINLPKHVGCVFVKYAEDATSYAEEKKRVLWAIQALTLAAHVHQVGASIPESSEIISAQQGVLAKGSLLKERWQAPSKW